MNKKELMNGKFKLFLSTNTSLAKLLPLLGKSLSNINFSVAPYKKNHSKCFHCKISTLENAFDR